MTKIIFVIADGLGDRPIKEFSFKTPLEVANTPNLDNLAKEGITGLMHTVDRGIRPGSDIAHLSLFGYDYQKYYPGRGVFEVLGIPMELKKGDIAFRGNLATIDDRGVIIDRRAGRIESSLLIPKRMKVNIEDVTFFLEPSVLHRVGVVMRGKNLTSDIYDIDPHEEGVTPNRKIAKNKSISSRRTEIILNKFMDYMHDYLSKNPENIKRKKQGLSYANFLNLRGPGEYKEAPSFLEKYGLKACCISGADLYKGIAKYLGMDVINVEGANGRIDTNLNAKINEAIRRLDSYDFIFVHMKFADSLAEIGDFEGKKKFIERIDVSLSPLLKLEDTVVFFSGDHSTSSKLKMHTGDPVPALIWGPKEMILRDKVENFGERACQEGGLGHFRGITLMNELFNIIGKQHLIGD
ncbi:MAG: 2,3-bisphosphoglycerate-independent phosphoglycerate mutase [Candidatus Pacearchaeota archaeon]